MKKATLTPMIAIIIFILFWVILVWCIILASDNSGEIEEIPPCMTPEDKKVKDIVDKVKQNHFANLVRLNVKLNDEDKGEEQAPWYWDNEDTGEEQAPWYWDDEGTGEKQAVWYWGLGRRGRFMLTLLSNYQFLPAGTLNDKLLSISITMDRTSHNNVNSRMVKSLFNIFRCVRSSDETPYEDNIRNDVICKEGSKAPYPFDTNFMSLPNLKCWNISDILNNSDPYEMYSPGVMIVEMAFIYSIPLGFIFLAFIYMLWRSCAGACNHHQPDQDDVDEYVNILQIKLIPLASQYWHVVYVSLVFLLYLFIVSYHHVYIGFDRDLLICSGLLPDALYILGIIILLVHSYRIANKCLVTKRTSILCYTVVFILCAFRFMVTISKLCELIFLIVCEIISEGRHLALPSSSSVNVISAVIFSIFTFINFFDNYQKLYYQIYCTGKDLDEKTFPHKIFEETPGETSQTWRRQFKIKSSLLNKIVERSLPFYTHLFNTISHFIAGLFFIFCVASIAIIIDDGFSSPTGYIITIAALVIGAKGNSAGYSFAAGGKVKNRSEDELLNLEYDLRYYAEKGEFPEPEPPSQQSFLRRFCPCFSRGGRERIHDEEYENLEGSSDSDDTSVHVQIDV